jgi:hypothetical protein
MNKSREMIRKLTEDLASERTHGQTLQDQLDARAREAAQYRDEARDLDMTVQQLQEKEQHYEDELEAFQQGEQVAMTHIQELERLLETHEDELKVFGERAPKLETSLKAATGQVTTLTAELAALTSKLAARDAELVETRVRDEAALQALTATHGELKREHAEQRTQQRELLLQKDAADVAGATLRERLEALILEGATHKATAETLTGENGKLGSLIKEFMATFETAQYKWSGDTDAKLAELQDRVDQLRQGEEQLLGLNREAATRVKLASKDIAKLEHHNARLQEALIHSEQHADQLEAALGGAQDEARVTAEQLLAVRQDKDTLLLTHRKKIKGMHHRTEDKTVAKESYVAIERELMKTRAQLEQTEAELRELARLHAESERSYSIELVKAEERLGVLSHAEQGHVKTMRKLKKTSQKALADIIDLQYRLRTEQNARCQLERELLDHKEQHREKLSTSEKVAEGEARRLSSKLDKHKMRRVAAEAEVQRLTDKNAELVRLEKAYLEKAKRADESRVFSERRRQESVVDQQVRGNVITQEGKQQWEKELMGKVEGLLKSASAQAQKDAVYNHLYERSLETEKLRQYQAAVAQVANMQDMKEKTKTHKHHRHHHGSKSRKHGSREQERKTRGSDKENAVSDDDLDH